MAVWSVKVKPRRNKEEFKKGQSRQNRKAGVV
jgi:hypothetical protein